MRYLMKSGTLTVLESEKALAHVKRTFGGVAKRILLSSDNSQYQTDIDALNAPAEKKGDVRFRVYTLKDIAGAILAEAHPCYAGDENPDIVGWPVYRVPKVDHAELLINGKAYALVMHNSRHYSLCDKGGSIVLQIVHRGISGGWILDAAHDFSAPILCGLFLFCRYLEQENEFIIV